MKSYTDISQSKKLAEILPLESADMCFNISVRKNMPPLMIPYSRFDEFFSISPTPDFLIPCWSLAALLNLCPTINGKQPILTRGKITRLWYCYYEDEMDTQTYDNPVDACVEMILKLKERICYEIIHRFRTVKKTVRDTGD